MDEFDFYKLKTHIGSSKKLKNTNLMCCKLKRLRKRHSNVAI